MFELEKKHLETQIKNYFLQHAIPLPEEWNWTPIPFSGEWGIATSFFKVAALEARAGKKVNVAQRAQEISETLVAFLGVPEGFSRVEAVKGYLNLYFSTAEYSRRVVDAILIAHDQFGRGVRKNARVMVEYSQPNTHKAFHVGHLRSAILGDVICRILDTAGYDVVRANYFGDIGLHVIKWLWNYMKYHAGQHPPAEDVTRWMGELYAEAARRLDENPEFEAEVREVYGRWDRDDHEIVALWKKTRQWSLVAEFNRLLEIPFYQQEKFTSIKLSNETQRLLALKDIKKEERIKLNRFLLEDSYPQEIAKSLKSFPLDELDAPLKAKLAEKIYKSRPPFWGGHIIPFSELPQEQKGNAILFWIPSPEEDKGKILWEEEPGVLWDNVFLSFPVAALGMGQNLEIPENNKTPLPGDSSLWALYTKALVALQEGKIAEFQENAKKIQAQPAKYPWLANALFQLEQRFVWKTQKKAMEDDITQKQKDLQEQEKKSQSLQNEIQSKEQEMKTLNSEKQLLENDLKAKEQETKKLNSEKQKLEKDIVQKQQELEDQKKQSEEKIQDLQKEIQYLQTQISQTQSQKNTIQEQINSKTKEIQSLKQTQEDWQKKLKENFKKWPEAVRQGTFQKT